MAAVLGDLLQITDFQTYLGQQVLNVYYYRVVSVTGFTNDGYIPLLEEFRDNVILAVVPLQSARLMHEYVEVRNLSNGVDVFTLEIDQPGTNAAASTADLPSYVSYSFKLVRESLATRHGFKRFAGVPDTMIDGNVYTSSTALTEAVEDALAADIVIGIATIAEPVIVKRPIPASPIASYVYSSIGSAIFSLIGTQNTRKIGRGS